MIFKIEENNSDVRLDRFLRKTYKEIPLTDIFKGIRVGKVKVNGKKSKENYRLKIGDEVVVYFGDSSEKIEEKFIELNDREKRLLSDNIVYDKDNIIVYNKKAGLVMHKGSGHKYGLSEMFKSYYRTNEFNFINRIDKWTSGLVIAGKNAKVVRELSEELKNRNTEKRYYIVVDGIAERDNFKIVSKLSKEDTKVIESDDGKESISYFTVLERGKRYTLLEATLETGRTHQLRVQLSNNGTPIVGDGRYGNKGDKLYLFSHYCKIDRFGIEIDLDIPEEYIKKVRD